MVVYRTRQDSAWGADLYIASLPGGAGVKIGRSWNVQHRMEVIQRGIPMYPVTLVAIFPARGCVEAQVHRELTDYRIGASEWFRVEGETAISVVARVLARHSAAD